MANENRPGANAKESNDMERLKQRVEVMDDRLDNIDSVLTAVAERVMKQPISIVLVCPHCGKNIEAALVGQQKPT